MTPELSQSIRRERRRIAAALVAELDPAGHWVGELSSSALSTATAVTALHTMDSVAHSVLVRGGLEWLASHANPDGGWGDTVASRSNLSTTALAWAAFGAAQADERFPACVRNAEAFLERGAGSLGSLVPAIEARYGKDKTFSVPIVMTLALSGRLRHEGWRRVRPLPFELAALPPGLFGLLGLPVVSYALPALIAIGQVIHHRSGRWHPLRSVARRRTLDMLASLQPPNGGFLEATPLTSFVTMSLAGMGLAGHVVARRGADFLRRSVRADGSWPIDTNLATWVTTLAVKALRHQPEALGAGRRTKLRTWLLGQQSRVKHPYTGANPGGWAWTDLPGGVPDADDTAGALLALHELAGGGDKADAEVNGAVAAGVGWLLDLQNRDGGVPTFCRGWGTLPFDRSTPELTAHALRAWVAWLPQAEPRRQTRVEKAVGRALKYLEDCQQPTGEWLPLWFGNEAAPGQANPVYGTAQVLLALEEIRSHGYGLGGASEAAARQWLLRAQGAEGGWGGAAGVAASVEETALAVAALANAPGAESAVERGLAWLLARLSCPLLPEPAPVGLYFAQLWYFERLYPLIFCAEALGRCCGGPS